MRSGSKLQSLPRSPIKTRDDLRTLLRAPVELLSAICESPSAFFSSKEIPKKNGEVRVIHPPKRPLKKLQRELMRLFLQRSSLRSCLHGGIKRRSTETHAAPHLNRPFLATLDIRKFYPSTSSSKLIPIFESMSFEGDAIADLLKLTLLNDELPQGAPTSCLLANLAFSDGDDLFIAFSQKNNLRYTRFVDDIAISGESDFESMIPELISIIESTGYQVATEKVCFMPRHRRQIVTGLVVNDKLRPTKDYVQKVSEEIWQCIKTSASTVAEIDGESVVSLKNRLNGQVRYIERFNSDKGKKLRKRLNGINWR